jgi:hypothetical protein
MTWIPLLLADPSPRLRMLVLRHLLKRGEDDPEFLELEALQEDDLLVSDLLQAQSADGSWDSESLPGNAPGEDIQRTAQAMVRLGYLGLDSRHAAVDKAANFLFRQQRPDGSWPLPEDYDADEESLDAAMMPLQTAIPLRGLAACGFATDPRAEKAYEWLLAQRLEDGAWPTGTKEGDYRGVAGYRRLAHSRWGCRSNTTAALLCLAHHPGRRGSTEAQRALDLLLGRETHERHHLGFEVARILGMEPSSGYLTFFARYDLALMLDLCWRVGASQQDGRVAGLVQAVKEWQGPYGLWEYSPQPQASRWITFDLLRSLAHIDDGAGWISLEPSTPFSAYPRRRKRF